MKTLLNDEADAGACDLQVSFGRDREQRLEIQMVLQPPVVLRQHFSAIRRPTRATGTLICGHTSRRSAQATT